MNDLRLIGGYADKGLVEVPPSTSLRRMLGLALKTWPYMRPLLKHLVVVIAFLFSGGLIALIAGLFGTDLFTNKVLLGEKLQPIQATVLFVGDEYVTTDPLKLGQASEVTSDRSTEKSIAGAKGKGDADLPDVEPELTQAQRKTVRNRLLIWGAISGSVGLILGFAFWYYSTWVWQSINQNLRVAMVEHAESLSLKFHNDSRVGDAIFRVYQDSAMIVNLLQGGIISPLMTLYAILAGLAFAAAFDPWFVLIVVIVGVPIGWLTVASTPRIRRRALANRIANSNLTSRLQEAFAAIKVVKANRAEARVFDRFDRDSTRALDTAYFLRLDMVLLTMAVAVLGGGMLILSEYIMVFWVIEGRETFLGALVAAFIGFVVWNVGTVQIARDCIEGLAEGARGLLGIWMRMQDLFLGLERAFYLLDQKPEVVDPDDPVPFPTPIERVSWRGAQFAYVADQSVLRGIDLGAGAGAVTAIVGATGTGKSTLMTLLLRLYVSRRWFHRDQRRRFARHGRRRHPRQHGHRATEKHSVRGHRRQEHRLRLAERQAIRHRSRSQGRLRRRVHSGDVEGLRYRTRRARRQAVRRTTAAVVHRPGHRTRHADSDPRRAHGLAGRAHRATGPGKPRAMG